MTAVSILTNDYDEQAYGFMAPTRAEAEQKAIDRMIAITEDSRDHDEFPTLESWIEVCLNENWLINTAELEGNLS